MVRAEPFSGGMIAQTAIESNTLNHVRFSIILTVGVRFVFFAVAGPFIIGKLDPVDAKVYCPCGEEAFDDEETTEEAQARRDCREAARRGRDAECWQGVGGGAADAGDQRGHAGSLAKAVRRDEVRGGQTAEAA